MKKVEFRSPTRVDLAGGTLDMWPLYACVGGAQTINLAINVWTHAKIEEAEGIQIVSKDLNKAWRFADMLALLDENDERLRLYQETLKNFLHLRNFKLETQSESPVGAGLGGSSSLMISMLKALFSYSDSSTPDTHQIVSLAHNIEARLLRTPTGTQDYYPAVKGGLSLLTYSDSKIDLKSIPISATPFAENLLLFYTGRSHHSGINNFDVLSRFVAGEKQVIAALYKIKEIAEKMSEVCLTAKWDKVPELFRQEYQARIQLTPKFSSPEIEELERLAIAGGAQAVKICGAGGGGCVLVWADANRRKDVIQSCQKYRMLNVEPVEVLKTLEF